MFTDIAAYGGLFLSSFLAATIIPAQSEGVFAALLLTADYTPLALFLTVSVGNILGAVVNYFLGRGIEHYHHKRWFPVTPGQMEKAKERFTRYGVWTLLFSWVPIIGDPLTVIAGVLRVGFPVFLLLVSIGKAARYLFLWYIISG